MVGITYSLWTYGYLGGTNTLQTGNVSLKLLESTSEIIDIKNALPKGDNEGKTQEETYNFAVTTTASRNTAISYSINIEKLEVDEGYTSLEDKDIKVYLEDYNNKEIVAPSLISNIGTKLYSKTNIHNSNNKEITDKYKLRVWLDKEVDISNWTKETKLEYKFKIGVTSKEVDPNNIEPNMPKLDTNMIPVYYDETTETWKKADSSNENQEYKWYNYDEKMWANSVTVSEENRSKYLSANPGIEIPMEDILTMQVWIPRYKYKVWNYNADGEQTSDEQEIQIMWEKGTAKTGQIECKNNIQGENGDGTSETCKLKSTSETCTDSVCNNKTYTHPAFTFGDEEIKGFWMGKFELTGNSNDITVKPNLGSISAVAGNALYGWEDDIMNMKTSGNQYGFTTNTDTHMVKNMEWGAAAYLSHSKYGTCSGGTCREVNINSGSFTGMSGGSPNDSYSGREAYKYNQTKKITSAITGGTEIVPTVTNDTKYPWTETNGLYKSSTQGKDSTSSSLSFDFTAPTDDTYLSFDWSASGNVGRLSYKITKDGKTLSTYGKYEIDGTDLGITESTLSYINVFKKLDKGTYKLTFTYKRDGGESLGTDTGYVKNIKIANGPTIKETVTPIEKGKDGPSASTTHNVYGVYDMSGCDNEYVMALMANADGTAIEGTYTGYDWGDHDLPNEKYYDKYSYSTDGYSEKRSKLGDATKEVFKEYYNAWGWYRDGSSLIRKGYPMIHRGGRNNYGSRAGIFQSYSGGYSAYSGSFRLTIIP